MGGQVMKDRIVVKVGEDQFSYPVRVVDWSRSKQIEANVAANNGRIQGEFTDELRDFLSSIQVSLGDEDFKELQFDALASDLNIDLSFNEGAEEPDLACVVDPAPGDVTENAFECLE